MGLLLTYLIRLISHKAQTTGSNALNIIILSFILLAENKKVLHEAEVEKMFIHLFNHEDVKVQAAATEALGVMAEFGLSRDCIIKYGEI